MSPSCKNGKQINKEFNRNVPLYNYRIVCKILIILSLWHLNVFLFYRVLYEIEVIYVNRTDKRLQIEAELIDCILLQVFVHVQHNLLKNLTVFIHLFFSIAMYLLVLSPTTWTTDFK